MKTDAVSVTNHKVIGMINALKESLTLAQDAINDGDAPMQKKALSIAMNCTARLGRLTFLYFYLLKIDSDVLKVDLKPADVNDIVGGVIKKLESSARVKNIDIIFQPEKKLPAAKFDTNMFPYAVEHVIGNAIDYMEKGTVVVSTALIKKNIKISVEDSGNGIAKSEIPRLFKRYEKIDTDRNPVGAGLGLAIVKEVMDKHKGKIELESTSEKGSKFVITLPV